MQAFQIPFARPAPKPQVFAVPRVRVAVCLLQSAILLAVILVNLGVSSARAQTASPSITSPTTDEALQGQVTITGTTGASNFASAELAFAYASDATNTWFVFQTLSQPVEDGALATWDTKTITDGDYVMRLRVFTTDGAFQDYTVPFEIANYTAPALASSTPAPTNLPSIQIPTPLVIVASVTPAPQPIATPTSLPPNPAAMPTNLVFRGLGRGALLALAAFLVLGAILLRRRS